MQHILIRTGVDAINMMLSKLEQGLSSNYIIRLNEQSMESLPARLQAQPMFSDYYLVYYEVLSSEKRPLHNIQVLSALRWVRLIVLTGAAKTYDTLKGLLPDSSWAYVDSYQLPEDYLAQYIKRTLLLLGAKPSLVTTPTVTLIRKRLKYKEYTMSSALQHLAHTDLSEKTIKSVISPYSGVSLKNFGAAFFDPKRAKYVNGYLYRYRYHINTLYKQVLKYQRTWLKLYSSYISGEFSSINVIDWIETHGREYDIRYQSQADKWLLSFQTYSYDVMLMYYLELQNSSAASNFAKVVALLKIKRSFS